MGRKVVAEGGRPTGRRAVEVRGRLDHPCLQEATNGAPLGDRRRTDKERMGVLLQGVALLGHLERAALHLVEGWEGATWDEGGLRVGEVAPGPFPRLPQELAADLLRRLFLGRRPSRRSTVAGRGEARRAARALLRRWDEGLVALPPDLLIGRLLEEAPFLWDSDHAEARQALAAVHADGEPWVVGPGPLRWPLLRSAQGDPHLLRRLVAEADGARLRVGPVAAACRSRPPKDDEERRACATAWLTVGRARRALEVLGSVGEGTAADLALVARCQLALGRLRAARRTAARGLRAAPGPEERLTLSEVEVRSLANSGDPQAGWAVASALVESFSSAEGRPADDAEAERHLARAHLIAAQAAWDAAGPEARRKHLAAAAVLETDPDFAPLLRQVRALAALAVGRVEEALGELRCALGEHRRTLPRYFAAGLWNDLGLARARHGDLAGAEKAFAHSLRLYRSCDGTRRTTLGLANLAEVRLRRGRLEGVEEILERTSAANRAAGNRRAAAHDLLLWGRYELAEGRAGTAVGVLRRAAQRCGSLGLGSGAAEARLLTARALGWLERPGEAAAELSAIPEADFAAVLDHLEVEERPAVLAQAGRRDEALSVAGPWAPAWQSVLMGEGVPPAAWAPLDELAAFRSARTVFDFEVVRPGCVPAARRREAVHQLRRHGADRLAARLEALDEGPWRALASHLAAASASDASRSGVATAGRGANGARHRMAEASNLTTVCEWTASHWGALLADAGHPSARIWWESEDDARVLVDGPGGDAELTGLCDGGRLVLRAPRLDPPLEALFHLLRREATAFSPMALGARREDPEGDGTAVEVGHRPPGGARIIGRSPELRRAVERAERLAAGEVPLLIFGETGTGKELVARRIHRTSRRRDRSQVTVNCAALSETLVLSDLFGHVRGAFTGADRDRAGVFETADGGTVFLDEIGDLPASAQGMLLRALQEGEVRRVGESLPRRVDVRVVAATHRDLAAMVDAGDFRRDLYYRLKGGAVELPPLRRRGHDVLLLAEHLLATAAERGTAGARGPGPGDARLSEEARSRLLTHSWPGNVRELENVLAVASALAANDGGLISERHLELPGAAREEAREGGDGPASGHLGSYHSQVEGLRRRLVEEALRNASGNQAKAAKALDLSRQAVSHLVRTLGIRVPSSG